LTLCNITEYGPIERTPNIIFADKKNAKRILHIGVHNSANLNAGDTLLFPVVRRLFDVLLGPFHWELKQAWDELTPSEISRINSEFDGIVLGGGGLLLANQEGSDVTNSGWQWNSTVEVVRAINVPLVVFAIGYNRFRGQKDFDSVFTDHINAVVEKASFFGLRNMGSINELSSYLNKVSEKKILHQFCPTTVLWQLYPEFKTLALKHNATQQKVISLNVAFDRANLRFGSQMDAVLNRITEAMGVAQAHGWKMIVVAHKTKDRAIEPYLDLANVSYDTVDLTQASPEDIMRFYARVDFVIGMRGHSQMVPFGLRKPVSSIISHNKMQYFLDDIERPEWGVEINSSNIKERLLAALNDLETDREIVHDKVAQAQNSVWEESLSNMKIIGNKCFGLKELNSAFEKKYEIIAD